MAHQVKIFDGKGNLKRILSRADVIANSDRIFENAGSSKRKKAKSYTCFNCKRVFKSKSTTGAECCPECRPIVYKMKKRRKKDEQRNTAAS